MRDDAVHNVTELFLGTDTGRQTLNLLKIKRKVTCCINENREPIEHGVKSGAFSAEGYKACEQILLISLV